ncbi:MAG: hypothetical protein ACFFG0_04875 [Candidatus Thorarchaeota archaeon]
MNDTIRGILIIGVISFLIITPLFFIVLRLQAGQEYRDNKVVDRGIITEKKAEDPGGFNKPTKYYFEIDNSSTYDVSKDDYNDFRVGDHVKIYESGRVEEID